MTLGRLAEAVQAAPRLRVRGLGTKDWLLAPTDRPLLDMTPWTGIVEHDVADQVVVVWAGTPVEALQSELARHGQALPLPDPEAHGRALAGFPGTVGGLVAANLPHGLEGTCGSVRDWVLRMTIVRPDGTVATAGSKAVKSVAGYDVHKALVGTQGTLAVVAQVAFLVAPVRALPPVTGLSHRAEPQTGVWIARCLPREWPEFRAAATDLVAEDPSTQTLWTATPAPRPREGWVRGPADEAWSDNPSPGLLARAKSIFDPADKLG